MNDLSDIETVVVGIGDLNGTLRGKRLPMSHYKRIADAGIEMSMVIFSMDMTSDVWDTPHCSMSNGYPDMHVIPSGELYRVPWEEKTAFTMATSLGVDHKPVPIDPRNALVRVLEKAQDEGLEVKIGPEVEFYLLDPETYLPKDDGIQQYGLARAAQLEHVVRPIRTFIDQMGISIEQSNPEYAAGQIEVNLHYDEALRAADNLLCFRGFVKEIAMLHNYHATFMAKPFIDQSGNGFHVHQSVWKGSKNLMSDKGKLSDFGRHYVAGLQKYMIEISLACSATPNAYKRFQPYSFCPINNSWGYDNRTLALRVIEGNESAVRVEKRDASADVNPYTMFALCIAAGLRGVEQKLEPSKPTIGDAYSADGLESLPTRLEAAINLAKNSEFMHEVLGDEIMQLIIGQAEREVEFNFMQVTEVERERYMRNF